MKLMYEGETLDPEALMGTLDEFEQEDMLEVSIK